VSTTLSSNTAHYANVFLRSRFLLVVSVVAFVNHQHSTDHITTVFPSTYRNDTTQSTDIKVDEQIKLSASRPGREGHESRYEAYRRGPREDTRFAEDIKVYDEEKYRRPIGKEQEIQIHEEERRGPHIHRDTHIEIERERDRSVYSSSILLP